MDADRGHRPVGGASPVGRHRPAGGPRLAAWVAIGVLVLGGCDRNPVGAASARGPIQVAAAENFWGSIAAEVGGSRVRVTSIITNPAADPHSYEPTPGDARAVAGAAVVVENGIGYDPWVARLLGADPRPAALLDVGRVLGVAAGANPHRWYDPSAVTTVVAAYVVDLSRVDRADAGYFQARAARFESVGLGPYHHLIASIRSRYGGTPVGASESIFSVLAPALDLHLITPAGFLRDVSEGSEVPAGAKAEADAQITHHLIRIYVYNSQNTTSDVQAQLAECRAAGIPTATITETLAPASASYQDWQTDQLAGIAAALHRATGR